jgi:phosphate transport system permease protein
MVALVALQGLLIAVAPAFALAVYVSLLAPVVWRGVLRSFLAGLCGVPTLVLAMQGAKVPVVFSGAKRALTLVAQRYGDASLALGASPWQTAMKIAVPAAWPELLSAVHQGGSWTEHEHFGSHNGNQGSRPAVVLR